MLKALLRRFWRWPKPTTRAWSTLLFAFHEQALSRGTASASITKNDIGKWLPDDSTQLLVALARLAYDEAMKEVSQNGNVEFLSGGGRTEFTREGDSLKVTVYTRRE